MICNVQNEQFINKILQLKAKDVKELLNSEDHKYISRKIQQMIRNMPEVLKPNHNNEVNQDTFLKSVFSINFPSQNKGSQLASFNFPSFMNSKSKNLWDLKIKSSAYKFENKDSNIILPNTFNEPFTFQTGIKGDFEMWKGERLLIDSTDNFLKEKELDSQLKIESLNGKNQQFVQSPADNTNQISFKKPEGQFQKQKAQEAEDEATAKQSQKKQQNSPNFQGQNHYAPRNFQQQSKHSPFIPSKINYLDLHTNKKLTPSNYLSPEVYSMNTLQFAHRQKRQNMFDDRYSYPNVVMGGSGNGWMKTAQQIRDNPFKKTFVMGLKNQPINEIDKANDQTYVKNDKTSIKMQIEARFQEKVDDVLKYTLGDRRFVTTTIERKNFIETNVDKNKNKGLQKYPNKENDQKKQRMLQNPFVRRPASSYKY